MHWAYIILVILSVYYILYKKANTQLSLTLTMALQISMRRKIKAPNVYKVTVTNQWRPRERWANEIVWCVLMDWFLYLSLQSDRGSVTRHRGDPRIRRPARRYTHIPTHILRACSLLSDPWLFYAPSFITLISVVTLAVILYSLTRQNLLRYCIPHSAALPYFTHRLFITIWLRSQSAFSFSGNT